MNNYEYYHQHPINKGLHFVCIPMIVLTSMNFLSEIKIYKFKKQMRDYLTKKYLTLNDIIKLLYHLYYFSNSTYAYFVMYFYFEFLELISKEWKSRDFRWRKNSLAIFVMSWLFQFLGHYIEGRRPALTNSLTTAFTEAPLFSIMYLF